ncbi:MAG: trypsin-like peptidase domain-containing protein, partial [Planctomycetota bacterium]|nr:trypsin-like peptidase domain-containing protein [Planctomycetota bacterium]
MRRSTAVACLVGLLIAMLLARHLLSHAPARGSSAPAAALPAPGRDAPPTEGNFSLGALPPDILARAKAASVFIQVRNVSYLDDKEESNSSGSGFLVSPDGRIVTNWHVVALYRDLQVLRLPYKQDRLEVILRPGTPQQRLYPARLIAARPEDDLALLKIGVQDMPCLELGDSNGLVETTPLWVYGFPLGRVF